MNVSDWLLDADPSIRWQVMRDLAGDPPGTIADERAKVATVGWGAQLLALQGTDGRWGGGTYMPLYTGTAWALADLRDLGLDPRSEVARRAVARVRQTARWEHADEPFFAGEVEPCVNGLAVAIGAYFQQDVRSIVDRLLGEQLGDGGWNCEVENGATVSSFGTTIAVLEGLLELEESIGADPAVRAARLRAHEYLLERRLFRRRSTGEVIDPGWLRFAWPTRYVYDVLRGLDYLRASGEAADPRVAEAAAVVADRRTSDGRWLLDRVHAGGVHVEMEREGEPSRWITLRALRVLRWAGMDAPVEAGPAA